MIDQLFKSRTSSSKHLNSLWTIFSIVFFLFVCLNFQCCLRFQTEHRSILQWNFIIEIFLSTEIPQISCVTCFIVCFFGQNWYILQFFIYVMLIYSLISHEDYSADLNETETHLCHQTNRIFSFYKRFLYVPFKIPVELIDSVNILNTFFLILMRIAETNVPNPKIHSVVSSSDHRLLLLKTVSLK